MQLSCAVRRGSYEKVSFSILHSYSAHSLHIEVGMTNIYPFSFASLLCALAYHVD